MSERDILPMQAAMQSDHDPINPPHYKAGDMQCIDAMEAALTREEYIGYLKASIMKYGWRLGRKGPALEDARKLHWFAHKLVSKLARG